jgi:hypothetical protein
MNDADDPTTRLAKRNLVSLFFGSLAAPFLRRELVPELRCGLIGQT